MAIRDHCKTGDPTTAELWMRPRTPEHGNLSYDRGGPLPLRLITARADGNRQERRAWKRLRSQSKA